MAYCYTEKEGVKMKEGIIVNHHLSKDYWKVVDDYFESIEFEEFVKNILELTQPDNHVELDGVIDGFERKFKLIATQQSLEYSWNW